MKHTLCHSPDQLLHLPQNPGQFPVVLSSVSMGTLNMFHIRLVNALRLHQRLRLQLIHHHLNNKETLQVNFSLCTWKRLPKISVWIAGHLGGRSWRNWFRIAIILKSGWRSIMRLLLARYIPYCFLCLKPSLTWPSLRKGDVIASLRTSSYSRKNHGWVRERSCCTMRRPFTK